MRTSVIFTSSPPTPRHRAVEFCCTLGRTRIDEGELGRLWSRRISAGALKDGMLTDGRAEDGAVLGVCEHVRVQGLCVGR